jgi:hypothetical protein
MVAPEVPTGRLIGQAVLDHEPHGKGDDAMGIVGFGQSVVGGVRVEEFLALGALMLRVHEVNVVRTTRHQVAEVVQNARGGPVAETRFSTTRTGTQPKIAATWNDLGFR